MEATVTVPYDRELLTTVLVYHQRKNSQYCQCGWGRLGASHPEHIVDVYEQSVAATAEQGQDDPRRSP